MESEHRVSPYLDREIETLVQEKTAQGKSAAYQAYHRNNALVCYPGRLKCASYEKLQELLDVLGISYKEFFQRVSLGENVTVDWATPIQRSMADMLDLMSSEQRAIVLQTIKEQLSVQTAEALRESEDIPEFGLRITHVLEKTSNEDNQMYQLYSSLGIAAKWRQKTRATAKNTCVPHEYMVAISNATGVSLHWMLGWNAPILAKYAETETVMDYFCFLNEDIQKTLVHSITTAVKTGGIVIG